MSRCARSTDFCRFPCQFLCLLKPGGYRIELFGDAGNLTFDPIWKRVTWTESQQAKGIIWVGSDLPSEFFLSGTPNVGDSETSKRVADG